ncbi:S8 family serine peptidase [Paractinoplanes lichenicola]|uniref:S8 family serine peptidase n=1 Tax=Paractinoplanes lichenicola TaxID=2802976 RepID=A0ABS1VRX9_9ACTN|nr:S8 family serine peptidase [Actinoplanes lichenicola]MBL7256980.1 S8 family serine peptidase [Actinoplanes lichenicola]
MKLTKRRVTVGLISTAVVVSMTSVTTWALAADNKKLPAAAAATTDRLVVGYKVGADRSAASRTMSAAGARVTTGDTTATSALSAINAAHVSVPSGRSATMISALRSDPNVAYVEKDVRTKAFIVPNDPSFSKQNEMYTVKAPAAWDTTTGGSTPVIVAVIDTGFTNSYEMAGLSVPGYDFANNDSNPADDEGHGTAVSALIAARGNNGKGMAGVCWTCKIMPIKVLDETGSGYDSDVAKGIIYAVQKGARILNLSLGSPQSSKVLADAVAYANMNGALVVAAAGNAGNTVKQYPGAYGDVLTVAASNRCPQFSSVPDCTTGTTTRSAFSSYNKAGDSWVDVAAPGTVLSMDRFGNYSTGIQGTSFSSPIVAGAAALIKSRNPGYTGWSLANAIYNGAAKRKLTNGGVNYGLLDIPASLNVPTDTVAPTATGITPGNGAVKRGTFAVSPLGLKDNRSGIRNSTLWVNNKFVGYSRNAPFGISYNFSSYKGPTKVELRIFDRAGNNKIVSSTITIDNTAPAVRITSAPKSGSKLKGKVTIGYTGSDAYGINRYELLLNGKVAQKHTNTTAFAFATTAVPSKFTVQVRAYDRAGNSRLSAKYSYTR